MFRDIISNSWAGPARVLAGLLVGLLFAVIGDVLSRVFNLVIGFPRSVAVHLNIQVVGIGLGAGIATYLVWVNITQRWYWVFGSLLLVLSGSILGAYLGDIYGPGPNPNYWWSRTVTDKTVYLTATIGGLLISTSIGLLRGLLAQRRSSLRIMPIRSS